jgi:hypothetical protein
MPFQPLGFRFSLHCAYPPNECSARIKAVQLNVSFKKDTAKLNGWVFWRWVYLTTPSYSQHRPGLYGFIRRTGNGSLIKGRAGYSLAASALNFINYPILLYAAYVVISQNNARTGCYTLASLICVPVALAEWAALLAYSMIVIFWTWTGHDDSYKALSVLERLEVALDGQAEIMK